MAEDFDPYLQWLGIRDSERPPNHYRLLGVELFEDDPEVLTNAADRQMAHVRNFQTGKHSAASQKVLNELAMAKVSLLNPQKKAAYDSRLRAAQQAVSQPVAQPSMPGPPQVPTPMPPPVTFSPPLGGVLERAESVEPSADTARVPTKVASSAPAAPSKRPGSPWIRVAIGVLVGLVVLLLALIVVYSGGPIPGRPGRADKQADRTPNVGNQPGDRTKPEVAPSGREESDGQAKPDSELKPSAEKPPDRDARPEPRDVTPPDPGPDPETPPKPQSDSEPEPVPRDLPCAAESIRSAMSAMSNRDPAAAGRHLDLAEKMAFPPEQAEIGQLRELLGPLTGFWSAVDAGMEGLKAGEKLTVTDRQVTVVRVDGDAIVVQDGDVQTRHTRETLPPDLAMALAERAHPDLPSVVLLMKAAFLAIDFQGDRRLARELCGLPAAEGQPTETVLGFLDRTEAESATPAEDGPPRVERLHQDSSGERP